MIAIKFKDGSFDVQETDKLELKVSTLIEQNVETLFVAKKKSDIEAFKQVQTN